LASSTALNGLAARKKRCPVTRSRLYGQRRAVPHQTKGRGMKKDLLTVKELAAELRMSPKAIQRAYRKEEIPVEWLGRMARFNLAKVRRAMEKKTTAVPTTT
jgi:hypothetical protein